MKKPVLLVLAAAVALSGAVLPAEAARNCRSARVYRAGMDDGELQAYAYLDIRWCWAQETVGETYCYPYEYESSGEHCVERGKKRKRWIVYNVSAKPVRDFFIADDVSYDDDAESLRINERGERAQITYTGRFLKQMVPVSLVFPELSEKMGPFDMVVTLRSHGRMSCTPCGKNAPFEFDVYGPDGEKLAP